MGLSSTTNRVLYTGDGSSTVFSFPYYFFSPSDLNVFFYDINSSIVTAQTLNTNYTISGNVNSQGVYPSGGSVVMTSAVPTTMQLAITRSPSPVQNYTLLQNGPINSLALTQQLDYVTALVQRLQDEVSRCIHLPDGLGNPASGTAFDPTLPASVNVPSTGGAPLITNSGATGFSFGVVATGASGAISYLGTLPVVNGGTGQNSLLTSPNLIYAASPTTMGQIGSAGTGNVLQANGSSTPFWAALPLSSGSGIISTAQGGTGASLTPTTGSLIYGSGAVFAQLAGGTANFALIATASSAPQWGLISLTSNISGILPALNGGTGQALTPTPGSVLYGSGATYAQLSAGTSNQVLSINGSSLLPIWQLVNLASGVAGILQMANGGVGISLAPTTVGNVITAGSGNTVTQAISGTTGFFLQSAGLGNQPTWASALSNPMTTGGDIIVGSSSGAATRLPNGSIGQVLMSQGTTQIPSWQTVGGNTQIIKAPTYQRFTTKGNAQTYTLPTSPSPSQIMVELIGGGATGNGSGSSGGTSQAGSSTTFGISFLVAGGGGAPISVSQGGTGGTNTVTGNSSVILINQAGGGGDAGGNQLATFFAPSGAGGSNGRGGCGGLGSFNNNPGGNGASPGGGGGGGGLTSGGAGQTGGGGGGGGYLKVAITNSIAATYSFSIGSAGQGSASSAGVAGQNGGGGGDGEILVTEIY